MPRTADRPYQPRRHRPAPPGTRKRRAGVQHSLQRKHQAVLTNCTRTPRRSKPAGRPRIRSRLRRPPVAASPQGPHMSRAITAESPTPRTPSRHNALTWTYTLPLNPLDAPGRLLLHAPCGTGAPVSTEQDPGQGRSHTGCCLAFPAISAAQKQWTPCITSRRRTCW